MRTAQPRMSPRKGALLREDFEGDVGLDLPLGVEEEDDSGAVVLESDFVMRTITAPMISSPYFVTIMSESLPSHLYVPTCSAYSR